jgi:hypothetical protein
MLMDVYAHVGNFTYIYVDTSTHLCMKNTYKYEYEFMNLYTYMNLNM